MTLSSQERERELGAPEELSSTRVAAVRFVEVISNLTKLGGLTIALNEALIRGDLRPQAIALAAFMMAGAQGLESLVNAVIGRR